MSTPAHTHVPTTLKLAAAADAAPPPLTEHPEREMSSMTFDQLVEILVKRSERLEQLIGAELEGLYLWDIAGVLHTLQEQHGVCLKKSDVDQLRARFLGTKGRTSSALMASSLDVLQILQDRKPFAKRRGPPASLPKEESALKKEAEAFQYRLDHTYGFVVLVGDHHTIARGSFRSYQILHDRDVRIANQHSRGGQSQNRFARLTEQSRVQHLNLVVDRMAAALFDGEGRCTVEKVVVAGPGPMKHQLLDHLPERWAEAVDQRPLTVDHVGALGMHELAVLLEARCATLPKAEMQRARQRARKEDRKDKKGQ